MTSWRWGRLRPRGFLILGLGCELSLLVGVDPDAQSADVDGAAVAGADLVEHGLARDPELASGLVELGAALLEGPWGRSEVKANPL
jgi:hypothetical protein